MATSVVYSGIFGAVLASIRAVSTRMVVFDTAVVDLTEDCTIRSTCSSARSSAAAPTSTARSPIARDSSRRPAQTILVLITDLYEGGNARGDAASARPRSSASGVQMVCLLALSDKGAPSLRPAQRGRRSPRWASRPSPARPTSSPT